MSETEIKTAQPKTSTDERPLTGISKNSLRPRLENAAAAKIQRQYKAHLAYNDMKAGQFKPTK